MGRVKLEIKRIENTQNRHVTFSKRRNGIIKKAYELAILCDVDIVLVMFSPSGRLCHFSGKTRLEEVVNRYLSLNEDEGGSGDLNREFLFTVIDRLRSENDIINQANKSGTTETSVEEGQNVVRKLQCQIQMVGEQLRMFEPDPAHFMHLEEAHDCEKGLMDLMERLQNRKNILAQNLTPYDVPSNVLLGNQEGLPAFQRDTAPWITNENTQHNATYPHNVGGLGSSVEGSKNLMMYGESLSSWIQENQSISSHDLLNDILPPPMPNLAAHHPEAPSYISMLQQSEDYRSNGQPYQFPPTEPKQEQNF